MFTQSGWTQAELARQLKLTRGGVNGIITGAAVPSESLIELLRLKLALAGKPLSATPSEQREDAARYGIDKKLAALPEHERAEVIEIFNAIVKSAERRVSYSKKRARPAAPGVGGSSVD